MQKKVGEKIEKSKKNGKVIMVLTDEEGLALVSKYYGIEEKTGNENCNAFDMLKNLLE